MPPERLLFVPPRLPEVIRPPLEIARESASQALKPVEIKLDIPELPPPEAAPKEEPIKDRLIIRARLDPPSQLPVRSPDEPMAPRLPPKQPALVSTSKLQPVDAPPRLDPLAQRLPRTPARPDREARIEEKVVPQATLPLRQKEQRQRSVDLFGGTQASEAAVERGIDWLAAHQSVNGSWSLNQFHANCKHPQCAGAGTVASDPAGTGIVLLPFLGAGYTHQSGKHKQTVARALRWLVEQQRPDGTWPATADARPMYGHGMASIALCEAYGMTEDPKLRGPAQKAIDYIVKAQHAALRRLALPAQPTGRHLRRRLADDGTQERRDGRAVGASEDL